MAGSASATRSVHPSHVPGTNTPVASAGGVAPRPTGGSVGMVRREASPHPASDAASPRPPSRSAARRDHRGVERGDGGAV